MLFARTPFSRWPLHHHVWVAVLVLGVLGTAVAVYLHSAAVAYVQQQTEGQAVQAQLRAAQAAGVRVEPPSFTQSLPRVTLADDVARDISRFAQPLGVQIASMGVDTRAPTATELGRVQFNLTAQADYKAGKAWLAELLARYPTLGVQTLAVRTQANDVARQDLRVALVLWVKD